MIKIERGKVIELIGVISLGYLFFEVLFAHIIFIFHGSLNKFTLPFSFSLYLLFLLVNIFIEKSKTQKLNLIFSCLIFSFLSIFIFFLSITYFSKTYDTSWDGQGYHSNGVIALSNNWNPLYDKNLPIKFPDASIFVKGYPKALWTIQSSFYLTTEEINSGKVTNLIAILIAICFLYTFLRRLKLPLAPSILLTLSLVFQAPFFIQIFSFSADLFSFEILLVAMSSLGLFVLENNINKSLIVFVLSELFLIGTKFSNLPVAGTLGIIFLFIFLVIKMDKENLIFNKNIFIFLVITSVLFSFIPYLTNFVYYKHFFYPSNLEEISESYKEDNIPRNLWGSNNLNLFFYSVFSGSQSKPMGKNDPQNLALLKMPFTFTKDEIINSASIFNNRVGSAGPLFSGIMVLTILTLAGMYLSRKKEAKIILFVTLMTTSVCFILTLFNPVPNLIRYNSQIVLIPFIVTASVLILPKSNLIKNIAYVTILLMWLNTVLFSSAVLKVRNEEKTQIDRQLDMMKNRGNTVFASNFYSNYIMLGEHQIPYQINKKTGCKNLQFLANSHYTTKICTIGK